MIRQAPAGRTPGERAPALPPGELSLNELYFTIQGECRFQGTPTVFVRVSHCPLRCTWCFGPDTRVLMGDGSWKRIADVLIGDIVMGRSRSNRLVRTTVTQKSLSERETVRVNGTIVTTPEHEFLDESGWRRVDQLVGRRATFVTVPEMVLPSGGHARSISVPARLVNWRTIESVTPTGKKETVIDLTTTDGSFVAEGFVVHNCDSKYTFYDGAPRKTADIIDEIGRFPTKHVCLTGGEPLAQAESFALIRQLAERGYTIEVETSGSEDVGRLNALPPSLRPRVTINLDIKCPGSAMTAFNRWENLAQLREHDQLKFIVQDRADYDYAKQVIAEHRVPCVVYVHPVWKKLDVAQLAEWVKADGLPVRVGIQMHKYVWGDVRGV